MAANQSRKELFSKRLVDLREKRELTQAELARKVGVSQTCVWNWEGGNTFPRPPSMKRLAQALGTTATYLSEGAVSTSSATAQRDTIRPLAEIITEARERVAAAAGLAVSKVRIVLDCGD